jgi:hypothetical protein
MFSKKGPLEELVTDSSHKISFVPRIEGEPRGIRWAHVSDLLKTIAESKQMKGAEPIPPEANACPNLGKPALLIRISFSVEASVVLTRELVRRYAHHSQCERVQLQHRCLLFHLL